MVTFGVRIFRFEIRDLYSVKKTRLNLIYLQNFYIYYRIKKFIVYVMRHVVGWVLCDGWLRTMSGGEPSSIKQQVSCDIDSLFDCMLDYI